MTIQILTTGRMESGKDEFADYLVKQHGFVKTAFADGIRKFIREYNPNYVYKSDRSLEIDVGNTMRRWFGDDVWIDWALNDLASRFSEGWWEGRSNGIYHHQFTGMVISDGRFPLEFTECVEKRNFIHVHIHADADVRKKRLLARDGKLNDEHFLSPDDCQIPVTADTIVLQNNYSMTEFHQKIDDLILKLQEGN